MNQSKAIPISILSGLILGLIGVHLMGYVAAIAIPKEYFMWFKENLFVELGMVILGIVEQFFGFGLLALITGYVLGKVTLSNWLVNSIICYLSVLFYFSVGSAFVYGGSISNPFAGVSILYFLPSLVLPACLIAATYIASTRYNKKINKDT
ncbi:hypothetical protein [Colwellia sp. TT2012]|uniref:hypothetical protein n=1 Tax=Colwellia sp. TT2012 TaxID=1720342 RepID=UPI00070DA883|nr:hypothetical protein [Colwellia sp. TT2012]